MTGGTLKRRAKEPQPDEQPLPGRAMQDKGALIAAAVAFGLVVVFLPFAAMLDDTMDRKRPMYDDVHTMDVLQYREMQLTDEPVAIVLEGGESANIGRREFSPSPGITIRVDVTDDGYCIQGRNQHGDVTKWRCGNGTTNPENEF